MHYTTQRFWKCYDALPAAVKKVADQNYELLKVDPSHPSLHFKKVGQYWSIRAGRGYRALGVEVKNGISRIEVAQAFINAIEDTVYRIRESPTSYAVIDDDVRRCIARRFPYGILF